MLTYINALLTDVSERGTPYHHNYWQEAISKDYFVKDGSGDVWVGYTKGSLVDLSNPNAYNWYKEIIIEVNLLPTMLCANSVCTEYASHWSEGMDV